MLFVSNWTKDRISFIREGFAQLDFVDTIEINPSKGGWAKNFLNKIFTKLKIPLDLDGFNRRIADVVEAENPDIIFIVKGNLIYPSTLKKLKQRNTSAKIVSFSNDNMCLWHNKTLHYHYGLNYYDLLISINIPAYKGLRRLFEKNILFIDKSYCPKYHFYEILPKQYDVIFIGSYERERYEDLKFLASKGIQVNVFGNMWERAKYRNDIKNLTIHYRDLVGDEYRKAICSSKIVLGFLRKKNNDTQTSRTFEIPACGGFMLMERTVDHHRLFEEGTEAEYFSCNKELLRKTIYYLDNEEHRTNIAQSGRQKCVSAGYSYAERVKQMLSEIDKL